MFFSHNIIQYPAIFQFEREIIPFLANFILLKKQLRRAFVLDKYTLTRQEIKNLRTELETKHGIGVFEIPDNRRKHKKETAIIVYDPDRVSLKELHQLKKSYRENKTPCDCMACSGGNTWARKLGILLDYPCRFSVKSPFVYQVEVNNCPLVYFCCRTRREYTYLKKKYSEWKKALKPHSMTLRVRLCESLL